MHEPLAVESRVMIERKLIGEDVRVAADVARLQQVFANLIGNAIKFCRPRDVVRVSADATRADFVVFTVADSGSGISDEELPHIFEPYWSATRFEKKGTGLGLYIAKGIVEAHGGTISVESSAGRGASFSFTIPKAR
jgi:signal transduction histidine kinase